MGINYNNNVSFNYIFSFYIPPPSSFHALITINTIVMPFSLDLIASHFWQQHLLTLSRKVFLFDLTKQKVIITFFFVSKLCQQLKPHCKLEVFHCCPVWCSYVKSTFFSCISFYCLFTCNSNLPPKFFIIPLYKYFPSLTENTILTCIIYSHQTHRYR